MNSAKKEKATIFIVVNLLALKLHLASYKVGTFMTPEEDDWMLGYKSHHFIITERLLALRTQ